MFTYLKQGGAILDTPYIHKLKLRGERIVTPHKGSDDMAVTVDDIKTSLRLDLTEDDTLIQGYLDSAKEYVQTAVSTTADLTQYKQYDFAVSLLTQFWYQNRVVDMKQTPYQVVSMIQQLRGLISE